MKVHLTPLAHAASRDLSFASSAPVSPRSASFASTSSSPLQSPSLAGPRSACLNVAYESTGTLSAIQVLVSATFSNGQPIRILQAYPATYRSDEEEPERDSNSSYSCQHLMDCMVRLSCSNLARNAAPPSLTLSLSLHASPRDAVKLTIDVSTVKPGSSGLLGKVLASSTSKSIKGEIVLPPLPHRTTDDLEQSPRLGPRPPRRRMASEMRWSPKASVLQNLPEELERDDVDPVPDLTSTPSTGSINSIATPAASLDEPWQPTPARRASKDRSADAPEWALRLAQSRSR